MMGQQFHTTHFMPLVGEGGNDMQMNQGNMFCETQLYYCIETIGLLLSLVLDFCLTHVYYVNWL